jgi:hypothetical protein
MDKGSFRLNRIDALIANAIHLCAWGEIRLPSGQLDMVLGIPADALQNALSLTNLPRNYVLQIPITGSIYKIEYETGPATAKLASLIAAQQIPKKMGLMGPLFNQMAQIKEDRDVPPPRRPFPWE